MGSLDQRNDSAEKVKSEGYQKLSVTCRSSREGIFRAVCELLKRPVVRWQ